CNEDKHETFPLVGSSVDVKVTPTPDNDAQIRVAYKRSGPFEEGTEILRVVGKHTRPNSKMSVQTEFWVREAFSKTGPAAGSFIGDQLKDIYNDIIEEVLPRFSRFFV